MYVFPKKVWNLHFKEHVLVHTNLWRSLCVPFTYLLCSILRYIIITWMHSVFRVNSFQCCTYFSLCSPSFSNLKESGLFQSFVFQEARCLSLNIQSYLPACIQSLLSINIILLTSGLPRTKKPWKNKGLKSGALFPFNPKFQKFWLVHCTSNGMDHFGLVWAEYSGPALKVVLFDQSGYLGLMNQNVPFHLTKLLSPLPLFRILLTRTIETFRF